MVRGALFTLSKLSQASCSPSGWQSETLEALSPKATNSGAQAQQFHAQGGRRAALPPLSLSSSALPPKTFRNVATPSSHCPPCAQFTVFSCFASSESLRPCRRAQRRSRYAWQWPLGGVFWSLPECRFRVSKLNSRMPELAVCRHSGILRRLACY